MSEAAEEVSISTTPLKKRERIADTFEPVNFEGQKETGIWVHHPGSETFQTWEPRKGKARQTDTEVFPVVDSAKLSAQSSAEATQQQSPRQPAVKSDSSSDDDMGKSGRKKKFGQKIQMGFNKFLHKHSKKDDAWSTDSCPSPLPNVKPVDVTIGGADVVVTDSFTEPLLDTPKENLLKNAKNMFKSAGKSARSLKQALSRKGSKNFLDVLEEALESEPSSGEDESVSSSIRSKSISMTTSSKYNDDAEVVETVQTSATVVLDRNKSSQTKSFPQNPPYASEPDEDSISKARLDKHKPNQAKPYPTTGSPT